MTLEHKIIIPMEKKDEFTTNLKSKLDELELTYKLKTKNVKFTEVTVSFELKKDLVKHIFNLVGAPQEEIEYLCKAKSIVEATVRDFISTLVHSSGVNNK